MKKVIVLGAMMVFLAPAFCMGAYSIPAAQLDKQQIYFGGVESFLKPAEICYEDLVKATPEYQLVIKKKVARGSGKYWILVSKAGDRAIRMINKTSVGSMYDLVANQGYLAGLTPAIQADNITSKVITTMKDEFDKAAN